MICKVRNEEENQELFFFLQLHLPKNLSPLCFSSGESFEFPCTRFLFTFQSPLSGLCADARCPDALAARLTHAMPSHGRRSPATCPAASAPGSPCLSLPSSSAALGSGRSGERGKRRF